MTCFRSQGSLKAVDSLALQVDSFGGDWCQWGLGLCVCMFVKEYFLTIVFVVVVKKIDDTKMCKEEG